MAVVINEFEVVPAPQPEAPARAAAEAPPAPAQPPPMRSHEVEAMVRRLMERAARVWAH
jgi:hypothetical protein